MILLRAFLKTVVAAVLFLFAVLPAYADLIPLDSRLGPDTLVLDTNTNLNWLVLPVTEGLSVGEVMTAVDPGGSLAEFRLASRDELVSLIESLGLPINNSCVGACFPSGDEFVDLFRGNAGLMADPITFVEPGIVELFGFHLSLYPAEQEAAGDLQLLTRALDVAVSSDGFFLVAETTPIPEPSTLAVLAGGLFGLALLGRRGRRRVEASAGR
jgi:hypothetical protein